MAEFERWKPVKGYEGLYEVSDHGNVVSLPTRFKSKRLMTPFINCRGYKCVSITKNKKKKNRPIHILVAEAFLEHKPQRSGDIQVDHIDGNKMNNRLDNLEIVTRQENVRRAVAMGRYRGHGHVKVIDIDTGDIYPSYSSAGRALGQINGSCVKRVCDGKNRHCKGKHFARLEDFENGTIPKSKGVV